MADGYMADEKLELLLNAALAATPEEREKSDVLDVGFDTETRTWEVIVKYHGSLLFLEEQSIVVEELLAGYAILTVPEDKVTLLSEIEQIEYVEKPKSLYFQIDSGIQASCILPVTIRPPYLSGSGVWIGIVDSGIDYAHPDFRNTDGSTKIQAIWDQSIAPDAERGWQSPAGFAVGVEFTKEQIDAATGLPVRDVSGHGTAVAGIATGVAPESELLIVKLGAPQEGGFPRTTELMRGITYLVKKAVAAGKPLAINLSFGNTYGSHDGTSLLERFMDNAAEVGRCVICVGSGNEGAAMGHVSGKVWSDASETETRIELSVGTYQGAFSVQLWKNYADIFGITLVSPGGDTFAFSTEPVGEERLRRISLQETQLLLYIGEPTPYSSEQEIYLDFLPQENYVNRGVWTFLLRPIRIVTGNYSMYLPSQTAVGTETRFFRPSPEVTLTIPSTASKVITVGAYDTTYEAYADFSGRGYLLAADEAMRIGIMQNKPDLAAPGVGIVTSVSGGGYGQVTGTSFATPFVTGAAALMMEWGEGVIIRLSS